MHWLVLFSADKLVLGSKLRPVRLLSSEHSSLEKTLGHNAE